MANQLNNRREATRLEEQKVKLNEAYTQVVDYERWVNGLEIVDPNSVRDQSASKGSVLGDEFTGVALDNYSNIEIQNYFTLHKMSRVISEIEARNRSVNVLRDKLGREKDLIKSQIGKVDALMAEAKNRNNQKALLKLRFERNKLVDLHGRISDYEIGLLAQDEVENYADLDVWGDFAIYGRNNITYVINTTKIETINDLSRAIGQIDRLLLTRKKNYEHRIAVIEEEIKRKEQEIRDKELQEIRASQKQYYEKEFFQMKSSEKPETDPYDYIDLVPEVVDVKAIEDSLKKLEIPVVEKPVEEETYIDTGEVIPTDTTGLQGSGESSSGGTDTGAGATESQVDSASMKKTDEVAVPDETKTEIPTGSGTDTKTDTTGIETTAPADTTGKQGGTEEDKDNGGGDWGSIPNDGVDARINAVGLISRNENFRRRIEQGQSFSERIRNG
jgi:hypothetical protein